MFKTTNHNFIQANHPGICLTCERVSLYCFSFKSFLNFNAWNSSPYTYVYVYVVSNSHKHPEASLLFVFDHFPAKKKAIIIHTVHILLSNVLSNICTGTCTCIYHRWLSHSTRMYRQLYTCTCGNCYRTKYIALIHVYYIFIAIKVCGVYNLLCGVLVEYNGVYHYFFVECLYHVLATYHVCL